MTIICNNCGHRAELPEPWVECPRCQSRLYAAAVAGNAPLPQTPDGGGGSAPAYTAAALCGLLAVLSLVLAVGTDAPKKPTINVEGERPRAPPAPSATTPTAPAPAPIPVKPPAATVVEKPVEKQQFPAPKTNNISFKAESGTQRVPVIPGRCRLKLTDGDFFAAFIENIAEENNMFTLPVSVRQNISEKERAGMIILGGVHEDDIAQVILITQAGAPPPEPAKKETGKQMEKSREDKQGREDTLPQNNKDEGLDHE